MRLRPVPLLFALSALSLPAAAHIVSGTVVDSLGNPVANVDLDAVALSGGNDPVLSGDFTDAFGNFAVDIPTGIYDLEFKPPQPPATSHVVTVVEDVVLSSPLNLGTIVLTEGVILTGNAVSQTGLPIAGVNVDVIDSAGDEVLLQGDTTNALGAFAIAAPLGAIEVQFKTGGAVWPTLLAPNAIEMVASVSTNLGDITMSEGFHVFGSVSGPGGPAVNIDLDFHDVVSDEKIFTQSDNSDGAGLFDIVVPAGTYDIEFCPPPGVLLAAAELKGAVVAGTTNLGATMLSGGVVLTGQITSTGGTPLQGIDVDLIDPVLGTSIPLCNDNTNASGVYSVVAPTGTFHVEFEAPYSIPYGQSLVSNHVIAGAGVLNGTVPDCPFFVNYGSGTAGTGGAVPHLETSGGTPREGNDEFAYALSGGLGGVPAVIAVATAPSTIPIFGGIANIDLGAIISTVPTVFSGPAGVPGVGEATFVFPVAIVPPMFGLTLYNQFVGLDPGAPAGFSMSEGMSYTFCP